MASTCISSCVDDARVPVRATYVNLYKWPESDFEFVRSMSSKSIDGRKDGRSSVYGHPRVVDSFSCRQMYLRSYTFSREEDYAEEKPVKCFGRSWRKAADGGQSRRRNSGGRRGGDGGRRKRGGSKKKKNKSASCSALASIFRRLLSCTTTVDVAN